MRRKAEQKKTSNKDKGAAVNTQLQFVVTVLAPKRENLVSINPRLWLSVAGASADGDGNLGFH